VDAAPRQGASARRASVRGSCRRAAARRRTRRTAAPGPPSGRV